MSGQGLLHSEHCGATLAPSYSFRKCPRTSYKNICCILQRVFAFYSEIFTYIRVMNSPVCLHLPDDLVSRLDAVAAADDRSRSAVVRRILQDALADHSALHKQAAEHFSKLQSPGRSDES
jgi:plasmid stability protein